MSNRENEILAHLQAGQMSGYLRLAATVKPSDR